MVDGESGLRDFSTPEAAEPVHAVQNAKRRSDGSVVVRLRVELPGVEPKELTVRVSDEFVQVYAIRAGELMYKLEVPCQRPDGYIMLSKKFHSANHTLAIVWGDDKAQAFDE